MKKRFNITGVCNPRKHYMVDISEKLAQVLELVESEAYFSITCPRQYGKTSMLAALDKYLTAHPDYCPIRMSFAKLSEASFQNEANFCRDFLHKVAKDLPKDSEAKAFIEKSNQQTLTLTALSDILQALFEQMPSQLVLLIDEVDASSNQAIFMTFLGILREHYLERAEEIGTAFHSVILAGVQNVRHLKNKIRPETTVIRENSPWNIEADFTVDMSFLPHEIQTMLAAYVAETGAKMNERVIAETIYDYTSGYPFLVSHICKIIDEQLLPISKVAWTKMIIAKAVAQLLDSNNVNFESLLHKLKTYSSLRRLLINMLLEQKRVTFNYNNNLVKLGFQYGIFRRKKNELLIHNKIYQQLIYQYLVSNAETNTKIAIDNYNLGYDFLLPTGGLDMQGILRRFQLFMKEQYNVKQDQIFLETNGRLLFMAFLQPILNGSGHMFREVQISAEKRLDLVITYQSFTYIVELKRWSGEKRHQEGIKQLAEYLDRKNVDKGYLLIFDFRAKNKAYKITETVYRNKQLFIAWV